MATLINVSIGFSFYAFVFPFCLILCTSIAGFAFGGGQIHRVKVSSLLPSSVCSPSSRGHSKSGSLQVVHRNGPCSQLNQDQASAPTTTQIISDDQSRVRSLHHQFDLNLAKKRVPAPRATLPNKSGSLIGSANYIVTVGLGTPKTNLSLIFDTGSGLTWTQCQPCKSCYEQQESTYNPSASKSYKNITCNTRKCTQLTSATGVSPDCFDNTCVYGIQLMYWNPGLYRHLGTTSLSNPSGLSISTINCSDYRCILTVQTRPQYGDTSFSVGLLGSEKLTLTRNDIFPSFTFGCGKNNQGLFRGAAGLLGLNRDPFSAVSQTASKYGKYFSYCLPSQSSSTGTLTFGKGGTTSKHIKFTPSPVSRRNPQFYFVNIIGIIVGGQNLSIPESVFKNPGTILDSGTVITRLQPAAYAALRTSFREALKDYNMTQGVSILDTCYDFSDYDTVQIPTISFVFAGNIEVPLDLAGIIYVSSLSQVCLAFAGNSKASSIGIFGNVQQQTLDVVHDIAGGKIGFGIGGCS